MVKTPSLLMWRIQVRSGWGTKLPHATWQGQKIKNKNKKSESNNVTPLLQISQRLYSVFRIKSNFLISPSALTWLGHLPPPDTPGMTSPHSSPMFQPHWPPTVLEYVEPFLDRGQYHAVRFVASTTVSNDLS